MQDKQRAQRSISRSTKQQPLTARRSLPVRLKAAVLGILFPRRCPVCSRIAPPGAVPVCPECLEALSWVRPPLCLSCGKEIVSADAEYCLDCSRRPRTFEGGMALLNYNAAAARSMAQIKYSNRREYLDFYAEAVWHRLGRRIRRLEPQLLLPVPIHPDRRRARGFNQAEELARRLSIFFCIPVDTRTLRRTRNTLPQKDLSPAERLHNLEQAFTAAPLPPHIHTVLLVDDIYTTGSTMEACARALKRVGIRRVYCLSLCIGSNR